MKSDRTQGFWNGLGLALIIGAFMLPMIFIANADSAPKTECAKQHGTWDNSSCKFPEVKNNCKDICMGA